MADKYSQINVVTDEQINQQGSNFGLSQQDNQIVEKKQRENKKNMMISALCGFIVSLILITIMRTFYLIKRNQTEFNTYSQTNRRLMNEKIKQESDRLDFQIFQGKNWNQHHISTVIAAQIMGRSQTYINLQKDYYQQKYRLSQFKQKPFCVVVPTYNNEADNRSIINIDSILEQEYSDYRVIIIDDASTDNTFEILKNYLSTKPQFLQKRVTLQKNEKRKKVLQNIFEAGHNFCNPADIMTIVQGDDFLLGKQVFNLFNAIYSKSDKWLLYSNFLMKEGIIGYSKRYSEFTLQNKRVRWHSEFLMGNQQTFYTELFRKIKQQDLKDEKGEWLSGQYKRAISIPMAQISGRHFDYLAEITFYDNINDKKSDSELSQSQITSILRQKPIYKEIQKLF